MDPGGEGSTKRAAMSTEKKCPAKAAGTEAPNDTRRWEDILVPRRRDTEDEEVEE